MYTKDKTENLPTAGKPGRFDIARFIALRISSSEGSSFSRLITRIAIISMAFGLAVMLVSFMVFQGFRQEIQEKIFSFAAHIQLTKHTLSNSYEEAPISTDRAMYKNATKLPGVKHIQLFSKKPALLKTNKEVMGVVLKGVSSDYDSVRFNRNLVEGSFINFKDSTGEVVQSNDVVISTFIANKLELKLHDNILIYFIQDPPRYRKLKVRGIYETGIEDFDRLIIMGDNKLIQRLNNWEDTLAGGYEIYVENFDHLDYVYDDVYEAMDYDMQVDTVVNQYRHFFDWFIMLNRNVIIFLSVILFVACFNTVSILLILIMERTNMIGTLKALGATNAQIRKIFLYNGYRMLLQGMFWGNLLALGLGFIQYRFHLIPLDPENYYMSTVPIAWNWTTIALLNLLMIVIVSLVLLIPTLMISRVRPIQSIRFD